MRDPRYPFLEEFRTSQSTRDGLNPITHLRGSQYWAYGGCALVTAVIVVLLMVAAANGWL